MHKLLRKFLPLVAVLGVLAFPAFAFGESNQPEIQRYSIDGKLEISSSESIKALYIRFDESRDGGPSLRKPERNLLPEPRDFSMNT